MKILIFTEGTILMHKNAVGHDRSAIVLQVMEEEPSVKDYAKYVPVGNAIHKIQKWQEQGGEIVYLTSRRTDDEVNDIRTVLKKYNFSAGVLEFRKNEEDYKDVAERVMPDILIEDDCESIGGEKEMTYPHIVPEVKGKIKSVVVKEFEGIDHLPDDISALFR
jgi:hypothetical protein